MQHRSLLGGLGALAVTFITTTAVAAPSGTHPRIWLSGTTWRTLQANATNPSSAAARVVTTCQKILSKPDEMREAGIQGYNWAYSVATCALSWRLAHHEAHRAAAVSLFRGLLDDYVTLGDGAGGDDVVRHDTGYAMRFFGAYAALAYDWLHDAPGVDDALRSHARARFKAWIDWYDRDGYLRDIPGSNYHAGYVFAKTLMSATASGEDSAFDGYWADVTTRLFPKTIVEDGLDGQGVLRGGDWPEGWQYGPMSVMQYALAARVLAEHGAPQPAMQVWADDLVRRFAYGMTPTRKGTYVAGDLDDNTEFDAPLQPRTLIAALAGPASDQAAAWALHFKNAVATGLDLCPVYDALAETRAVVASDFQSSSPPTTYLAAGTRNLYTRSSWNGDAVWAVFTASPKLVPDHQHSDASNFVLYRGADRLIVDPSPYGSRSSLTANALTADSNVVPASYRPSQSPYSGADLAWTRATTTGVVAARAELGEAFRTDSAASDVPFGRRDWVFLPEGEVIAIDKTTTGDTARKTYIRFRSPLTLAMQGDYAEGQSGSSRLVIHRVSASSGTPRVSKIARDDCWSSSDYGRCRGARIAVDEYAVDLAGPRAHAVHVLDALDTREAMPTVLSVNDARVDPAGINAAYLGASIERGSRRTYVIGARGDGPSTTMTYRVPAPGRHVVFDAPTDGSGRAQVISRIDGTGCIVNITAGAGFDARPLVFTLANGCAVTGEPSMPIASDGGTTVGASDAGTRQPVDAGAHSSDAGEASGSDGSGAGSPFDANFAESANAWRGCSEAGSQRVPWLPIGAYLALAGVALGRLRRRGAAG